MIDTKLSKYEWLIATKAGLDRMAINHKEGKKDKSKNGGFSHLIGTLGEFAVCKYLNTNFKALTKPDDKGRYSKNDVPGFTRPIDVKTSIGRSPSYVGVTMTTKKEYYIKNNFDFIFTCYFDFKVFIIGYIPAVEFFATDGAKLEKGEAGEYDRYILPVPKLYALEEFVNNSKRDLLK